VGLFAFALLLAVLWGIEYVRWSELTSEAKLIPGNELPLPLDEISLKEPVYEANRWLNEQLNGLDAHKMENKSIRVIGTPQPGWICPTPFAPERCHLQIEKGYRFTGFVCRFRGVDVCRLQKTDKKPIAVAMIPITLYSSLSFNVPQAAGAENNIVVMGLLLKEEGAFPEKDGKFDELSLNHIISLKTWRKD
jgi:hypothetical protein